MRSNRKHDPFSSHEYMMRHKKLMSCPYIFPSTSRCPGNYIQEGVGEVTIAIEGIVSTPKRDVAEIPAWRRKETNGELNGKKHRIFVK